MSIQICADIYTPYASAVPRFSGAHVFSLHLSFFCLDFFRYLEATRVQLSSKAKGKGKGKGKSKPTKKSRSRSWSGSKNDAGNGIDGTNPGVGGDASSGMKGRKGSNPLKSFATSVLGGGGGGTSGKQKQKTVKFSLKQLLERGVVAETDLGKSMHKLISFSFVEEEPGTIVVTVGVSIDVDADGLSASHTYAKI